MTTQLWIGGCQAINPARQHSHWTRPRPRQKRKTERPGGVTASWLPMLCFSNGDMTDHPLGRVQLSGEMCSFALFLKIRREFGIGGRRWIFRHAATCSVKTKISYININLFLFIYFLFQWFDLGDLRLPSPKWTLLEPTQQTQNRPPGFSKSPQFQVSRGREKKQPRKHRAPWLMFSHRTARTLQQINSLLHH